MAFTLVLYGRLTLPKGFLGQVHGYTAGAGEEPTVPFTERVDQKEKKKKEEEEEEEKKNT